MSLVTTADADPSSLRPLTPDDHTRIAEVVTGVGLYADLRDWARVERFLAPKVTTDYVSLSGGTVATADRSALVAQWRAVLPGFDATQHQITNLAVQGAGDDAEVTSHVRATHWIGEQFWTVGGIYSHRLARSQDGWRVTFMGIKRLYEEGDRKLLELATSRVAKGDQTSSLR